jgi:hypothetical protein
LFTVSFSESVTWFDATDPTRGGTATGGTVSVTGSGASYEIAVTNPGSTLTNGSISFTIAVSRAQDLAGNNNSASSSTDNTVTYDTVAPTVTINQAAGQGDPTNGSTINFTVVFSESVTGFAGNDLTLSGSAAATTATVTGSGATYNVAVSGMTSSGSVSASVAAAAASDGAGNASAASTSTDNTVSYDNAAPTVTINQAGGQSDPTNAGPINFTVVFSEPATGFATGDVTLTGTAGATTATVTGSGATYNVAVTGMTSSGTVTATIAAGKATDAAGNGNTASTSADNSVSYDNVAPTVSVNQKVGQADPTNTLPILFTVSFSEPVTGFDATDLTRGGTSTLGTVTVTGSGASYEISVSGGALTNGTLTFSILAGKAQDLAGNNNTASSSSDNSVTYDTVAPTVTINQAAGQGDPTNGSTINFTVVFSENVTGFSGSDVSLGGSASATTAVVTGSGTTYNVAVSGMTTNGAVTANVVSAAASDAAGNNNAASTSTDNIVTYDTVAPTVTVNQAVGQNDPTNTSPINFTVVFSEPVTGFVTGDVTLTGAGATTATVTGSGTTYNVAVTGMTGSGTVTATVGAAKATDAAGNNNTASTSTDNTVGYDSTAPTVTVNQKVGQADPTNTVPILFTVTFSEPVTGFVAGDLTRGGTATGGTVSVSGSGASYEISVSGGSLTNGTLSFTIAAGAAQDAAGNTNTVSASTDNTVAYDTVAPTLTTLEMLDTDANGKVDQVKATFNETLDSTSYTPSNTPWTVNNVPSLGTKGAVSISGASATLAITEGTGAPNTAVGSFTVALAANSLGVRDAAGNQASFGTQAPADKAAPVPTALTDTNGTTDGLMQAGDTLTVTFSEALLTSTVPTTGITATVSRGGTNSNVLLAIAGIANNSDTGSSNYFSTNGPKSATFSGGTAVRSGSTFTFSVGSTFSGDTPAASQGTFTYVPAATITDAAGNAATGSFATISTFKLF